MVDFLHALDLGRLVREVLVDGEAEAEGAALVHALVRLDGQDEVHDVVVRREVGAHRVAEREFRDVCTGEGWDRVSVCVRSSRSREMEEGGEGKVQSGVRTPGTAAGTTYLFAPGVARR